MPVATACPECSRKLRVPDDLIGKRVKCPGCSHTFTVAADEESEPVSQRKSSAPPPPPPPDDEPDDRDEEIDDERPSRRKKRRAGNGDYRSGDAKPGKVQAIAIMMLIGGIMAILIALSIGLSTFCIYFTQVYGLVMGILAIVKASKLLGNNAAEEAPPSGIAIMMIINIINLDWINCVLGIIILVFLGDPEVKGFFRGGRQ